MGPFSWKYGDYGVSMKSKDVAIFYQEEAYQTSGPKLMGRNSAGESFLKGYVKYGSAENIYAYRPKPGSLDHFNELLRAHGSQKRLSSLDFQSLAAHASTDILFYPGPDLGDLAFQRSRVGSNKWSLCGVTHTTSSARAMDAIIGWLTAPVEPWDAIICTSSAVKKHVEKILNAEVLRLRSRLGIKRVTLPLMPIIPLGIHVEDFTFTNDERIKSREKLGISDSTIIVLYMGRLSFHAKANPLPMYQALETLSKQKKRKIVLIECGWFDNSYIEGAFKQAQLKVCPSVDVVHLDGRDIKCRNIAWASADIFCSLADNIQETFGLTPIEAMAAGLPVVVSDWDGYKETVTESVGFRVETKVPYQGLGEDLITRYVGGKDNYDFYCGHSSTFISVDALACAEAIGKLIDNPNLRRTMGLAGRQRARKHYNWTEIIPIYESLWENQRILRGRGGNVPAQRWPARLDPFLAFSHYGSSSVWIDNAVQLTCSDRSQAKLQLEKYLNLEMVSYAAQVLPQRDTLMHLISRLSGEQTLVSDIVDTENSSQLHNELRALSFLHKIGLITFKTKES